MPTKGTPAAPLGTKATSMKLKDLHLATSLEELNNKVSVGQQVTKNTKPHLLQNTMKTLLSKADLCQRIEGDEEQAYLYYMRALDLFQAIRASKDESQVKSIVAELKGSVVEAMNHSANLSDSLKVRYDQVKEVKDEVPLKNGMVAPVPAVSIPSERPAVPKGSTLSSITPKELYLQVSKKTERILVLDCRSREDYDKAHLMDDIPNANIPSEIIKPGLTGNKVTELLEDPATRELWKSRHTYDRLVLCDAHSTVQRPLSGAIKILYEAMTKWDPTTKYKGPVQILDRGLVNYYHWYPYNVTHPIEERKDRKDDLKLNHISYAFEQDGIGAKKTPLTNGLNGIKDGPEVERIAAPPPSRPTAAKPVINIPTPVPTDSNSSTSPEGPSTPESEPEEEPKVPANIANNNILKPRANINLPLRPSAPKPTHMPNSVPRTMELEHDYSYTTKLKDHSASTDTSLRSPTTTFTQLKRSHSNPNIAQMPAADPPATPGFNRSLKPNSSSSSSQNQSKDDPVPLSSTSSPSSFFRPGRSFNAVVGSDSKSRTGLKNLGNSCYMNSVLQCLNNTTALREFFLNHYDQDMLNRSVATRGEVTHEFYRVIRQMNSGHRSIAPTDLKNALSKHRTSFAGCSQQDAHELLTIFLEWLQEELNRVPTKIPIPEQKNDGLSDLEAARVAWKHYVNSYDSIITRLFCGLEKHSVQCGTCAKTSVTFVPFLTLNLPLSSAQRLTLQQCIDLYTESHEVHGFACDRCKRRGTARKKTDLWKLPPYLIISLQRFYDDGYIRKRFTDVGFSAVEPLDLSPYVQQCDPHFEYNLYAVSNHYGTMDGGHYTAYCRKQNEWFKFDDSDVYGITPREVTSVAAYILFYESTNISTI